MTTESLTELEAFYQYLGDKLKNGASKMGVDESVQEFRAYQRELEQLRDEVLPALERSLRGESKPFDLEGFIERGRNRLSEKGIAD